MKFMEKVWGNLGLFEASGQEEEPTRSEAERKTKRSKSSAVQSSAANINNVVSLPTFAQPSSGGAAVKQMKVIVVEPVSFDDVQHVADYLKSKKPVVINLENADSETSRRMIDFISGTTYALSGTIQKVGNHIFLCAPHNVDVSFSSRDEVREKNFLVWNQD